MLDDTTYLHVQPCDTGWDYTLYDAATMKQLDGGQLDGQDLGRSAAVSHICEDLGMGGKSVKYAPLSKVMHSSLRAFEFMEVGSVFEQRYGKEQHDQRIAYADHRIVQALHHAPYCATLKSLGAGSHQPPKLC